MVIKALIGYTGFVGSNLMDQTEFDCLYNSNNINNLENKHFDLVVCAAPSAEKWKANKEPQKDLKNINNFISNLKKIKTQFFIQISTVDVYKNTANVNENTPMELEGLHPYGKNRLLLEEFVKINFDNYLIIRLPALFGHGIKKNFVYDMINNNCLDLTDKDSEFQFYYLDHLWNDITIAIKNAVMIFNITSEPISAHDLAIKCFKIDFQNKTMKPPVKYDIRSKYDYLFNGENGYMYNKDEVFKDMMIFLSKSKKIL